MNLLFEFLKNLDEQAYNKLARLNTRGTKEEVWLLLYAQARGKGFDKKQILAKTGVSVSHFDKITSELLLQCYQMLFGTDTLALLRTLARKPVYIRHFYNELVKQLRLAKANPDKSRVAGLIRECFRIIHTHIPMSYRDEAISARMAQQYVALYKGTDKTEARFYVGCKLLFEEIDRVFAASTIHNYVNRIEARIEALGKPGSGYAADTVFDYYWVRIFFSHACEDFARAHAIAVEALQVLAGYDGPNHPANVLRIQLKVNEFLYFLSEFGKAYNGYRQALALPQAELIPDKPYHVNKYIQLCMVTGHLAEAWAILGPRLAQMGGKEAEIMITRDVITYVKYYLFAGMYNEAYRMIQLGFEKNPKGKYFQYELELRNLQTAYFYFAGQQDMVLALCRKNIKFLRNHNYTSANSSYPHYYLLVRIIASGNAAKLTRRQVQMLNRYQQGSYAVYGRLLNKLMEHQFKL
jgi:hypothetical protein